ncbi:MAG: hypothetical protein DRP52_01460, partial [Planctomycetota bacterium]
GSYISYPIALSSPSRSSHGSHEETPDLGFRVASVPEPCSLVLLLLGGLTVARRRR